MAMLLATGFLGAPDTLARLGRNPDGLENPSDPDGELPPRDSTARRARARQPSGTSNIAVEGRPGIDPDAGTVGVISQLDTTSLALDPRPRRWVAPAMEILGTNTALAAWNNWVAEVEYARIDEESIWRNLTGDWVWDDNNFEVNQIGHPVQGGLYYSLARANGWGYLGGIAWTTAGSIQWEYFMETEPPSVNDLVTTRMGGAMIGETTWRLAQLVSGESTGERVGWIRETGAFLVNPVYGTNRLLSPSRRSTPARKTVSDLGFRITTGRSVGKGLSRSSGVPGSSPVLQVPLASTSLRLSHGDPFEATTPFDHFSLSVGMSVLRDPVANISLRGQLWHLPEWETENSKTVLGLAQGYDYINSTLYRVASSSMGIESVTEADLGGAGILRMRVQAVGIGLGAASTEYYHNIERDYNYGPGAGWKTGLFWKIPHVGRISGFADRYWIHTQSGAPGDETIDIQSVELVREIWRGLGVGLGWNRYDRHGSYEDFPAVRIANQEFRVLATYGH
ncbi:MAG: DUF3943 domain-containing protein [Fibrobacteria bacterium]|nr:DUF3943 domain-containing protein [Fibrobacteria bacterium]